ncbi:DUF2007 domain-containing protein [Paracoccus laeviglucosivorans]|nr:DUF2007 domain-containing protein [Paracoccus laeviglucosivorans]
MTKTTAADPVMGDLELVAHAYRWHEAYLAAQALRAADIPADVLDGHTHHMMPYAGIALGGFRIVVPASHSRDALDLLATLPAPRATQPLWLSCAMVALVWWVGIGGMAGLPPMMSGLYLRQPARIDA